MATATISASSTSSFTTRDGAYSGSIASPTYPYSHKRGNSNQQPIPRLPKTLPPKTAPPLPPPSSLPTYDFQFDQVAATPSPFRKRDLIARTPDQVAFPKGEWTSTIPILSPTREGGSFQHLDPYRRPDALTPENSSEEDREVEETPIYLRSERYRQSLQNGRYTPNSRDDEEYDADSILAGYNPPRRYSSAEKRYSSASDHSLQYSQPYETPIYLQRSSWTARSRDITPSKIPIFHASPKPIPMEYIFRSAPLHRSPSQPLDDLIDSGEEPDYNLKRVRSESLLDSTNPITPTQPSPSKRKYQTLPRPRSRSLSSMRPNVHTPRSQHKFTPSPAGKKLPLVKGEPPWIQHNFSPSPYLPPEEQLIPTIAKKLNQERLEREKGLVTVWDRDMRPLEGDKRLRESRVKTHKEADDMPTGNILVEQKSFEEKTWPLNIDVQKAKADRLSVYPPATPQPISPGGPIRVDAHVLSTTLGPMQRFEAIPDRRRDPDDVKKGCCCIVM